MESGAATPEGPGGFVTGQRRSRRTEAVRAEANKPGATFALPLFADQPAPATIGERAVIDRPVVTFEVALLGLSTVRGLGRKGLRALIDGLEGNLERVWWTAPEYIEKTLAKAKIPGAEKIAREIADSAPALVEHGQKKVDDLSRKEIHVIPSWQLPLQLREIPDAPRWLFVQGNLDVLQHRPAVAVVGTRKPTSQGERAAAIVAKMLAAYPILLVSGLAEGIDKEAHKTSLQEGVLNLAFLGHGINLIFPAETKEIRQQIVERGGVVATEYLPDEHYQRSYFVERNRLQAAMADLVIPVEAGLKGGTAHTVRFARKYRRAMLGIRWKNADGLLDELQRDGYPIIDIFAPGGRRKLDGILRDLAERAGHETYALSLIERRLINEAKSRNVRVQDVKRLTETLQDLSTHTQDGDDV